MRLNTKRYCFKLLYGLIGIVIMISGCSTKKDSFPNRAYHTVVSRYNIIFNGQEALKEGEDILNKDPNDNYTSILKIYSYPLKEKAIAVASQMDRAIEKCSKSIVKHSMLIKGVERVKPIDNAYLIMGTAYFNKQEYTQAARVFSYMVNIHKNDDCYHKAMIMLARSYIRNNNMDRAEKILDDMRALNLSKKDKVLYDAAQIELRLEKNEWDQAVEYLEELLTLKTPKDMRLRAEFILGQIYENADRFSEASKMFFNVLKHNPSYQMEFNARMHLATAFDAEYTDKDAILKELDKMIKDTRNKPYLDQIYYAISEIERRTEENDAQVENLRLSVAHFDDNNYQRTLSSLTLANIYFEQQQYTSAQAYFDTATIAMPKDYPNYNEIIKRTKILTELVTYLSTIQKQDSLLRLASMPEKELDQFIDKIIKNVRVEEERVMREEAERTAALAQSATMKNISTGNTGKWYFYNQALITNGKAEFAKRFGNRKLEDNWFVSNKQQINFDDLADMKLNDENQEDTLDANNNPIPKKETNNKTRNFYKQNLPFTQQAKVKANDSIAAALFNVGIVYYDFLDNLQESNKNFQSLTERYPEHELNLPALFMLYRNNQSSNPDISKKYATIIIQKYPDSEAAKVIKDPKYLENIITRKKIAEANYEKAYLKFEQKKWQETVDLCNIGIQQKNDSTLQAKYYYIRAYALSQLYDRDTALVYMNEVSRLFPKTKLDTLSQTYLRVTAEAANPKSVNLITSKIISTVQNMDTAVTYIYTVHPDEYHFMIIIADINDFNTTNLKRKLSDFNTQYFSLKKLNISNLMLDQNRQMFTIAKFPNQDAAMDYYGFIKGEKSCFTVAELSKLNIFAISSTNYGLFYNKPNERTSYQSFFEKYYLNQ